MKYYIGIDLGTSSVRALLINSDGTQIAVEGAQYDVLIPRQGYAEQDAENWYVQTARCIRKVIAVSGIDPSDVAALSFSGQMHGLVALNAQGKPVANAIIWLDQRSGDAIEEIYARLGRDWVTAHTQNAIATGFLIASLYWMKTRLAQVYRDIRQVMLPKDYIKYRLCGCIATDYSDAAGSLAFDNERLSWSDDLIEALGIDRALFPECRPSTQVMGCVTREASDLTGLSTKTLVVNGGADQCMQAVGNAIVTPGVFALNIGTAGQVSTTASAPVVDPLLRTNTFAHVVPGCWNVMGACLNSGISRRWFSKDILNMDDYRALDAGVKKVEPGSGGLIFLPYLTGERTPHMDPKARGMFFGLTLKHGRMEMERAVMEGVVYALKDCLNILKGLGIPCEKVIAAGGGAKSDAWLQMQADIFECAVYPSASSEQACLGAALTAMVGSGAFSGFEAACQACVKPVTEAFYPIEANARVYRELYSVFDALYPANKALFARVSELNQGDQ
ncbi:MAG: xylulokinase [Clostridia bacterium]